MSRGIRIGACAGVWPTLAVDAMRDKKTAHVSERIVISGSLAACAAVSRSHSLTAHRWLSGVTPPNASDGGSQTKTWSISSPCHPQQVAWHHRTYSASRSWHLHAARRRAQWQIGATHPARSRSRILQGPLGGTGCLPGSPLCHTRHRGGSRHTQTRTRPRADQPLKTIPYALGRTDKRRRSRGVPNVGCGFPIHR